MTTHDWYSESVRLHEQMQGKITITPKAPTTGIEQLSLLYSPGVAEPCREIARDPERAYDLTCKRNLIAVVSDGSAVLGLGNMGGLASYPVMEGKALLFKSFANVDAIPLVLDTQDTQEIIDTVKRVAPTFGGINLEDIAAPKCFEVEEALQDIGIPVFHDDQHGTAIVTIAGLINACKLTGRKLTDLRIIINGSGAAGVAIAKLLAGHSPGTEDLHAKELIMCDSKGVICSKRDNLNASKKALLEFTNPRDISGTVQEAMADMDVFIGVSVANLLEEEDVKRMAPDPILFVMANPDPEITPEAAHRAGASIVGTGRSDYPNQINNVLAFPGIFRGALDARARRITDNMKVAAARALASLVDNPTADRVIPYPFDPRVAPTVAYAVAEAAKSDPLAM